MVFLAEPPLITEEHQLKRNSSSAEKVSTASRLDWLPEDLSDIVGSSDRVNTLFSVALRYSQSHAFPGPMNSLASSFDQPEKASSEGEPESEEESGSLLEIVRFIKKDSVCLPSSSKRIWCTFNSNLKVVGYFDAELTFYKVSSSTEESIINAEDDANRNPATLYELQEPLETGKTHINFREEILRVIKSSNNST